MAFLSAAHHQDACGGKYPTVSIGMDSNEFPQLLRYTAKSPEGRFRPFGSGGVIQDAFVIKHKVKTQRSRTSRWFGNLGAKLQRDKRSETCGN